MKSIEEQMTGIRRRKDFYINKRLCRRLTGLAAVMAVLLVFMIMYAPGVSGRANTDYSSYLGSTILGPAVGGYVIVALLAFMLGVVVTLAIQKYRKLNNSLNTDDESRK